MERISITINKRTFLPMVFKEDVNKLFNYLLTCINDKYSPLSVRKENLVKLMEFMVEVMEVCEEKRGRSRMYKLIKHCLFISDPIRFESFFYNLLLVSENKPLLNGFGFSNRFGDNVKGDPEKQSILTGEGWVFDG